MQQDREFTRDDRERLNPCGALSINTALDFVKNPVRCCEQVHELIQRLVAIVRTKREDPKTRGGFKISRKAHLEGRISYHLPDTNNVYE